MRLLPITISLFQVFFVLGDGRSQSHTMSALEVSEIFKGNFSFTKKWNYSEALFKEDSSSIFKRYDGEAITAEDTAQLFFTADCETNVQGGYHINYCFASIQDGALQIKFSDGLPAYGSSFYVYVKNDSFYFEPATVYPMRIVGERKSFEVVKQKLILNKMHFSQGEIAMGFIDATFVESVSVPNQITRKVKLYLRGYFKVPVE